MTAIWRAWPWMAALLLGASAGLVFVPKSGARAHLDGLAHITPYTYAGINTCVTQKDPVNLVFYYSAGVVKVNSHAAHHGGDGGWDEVNGYGVDQSFLAHGCQQGDGQAADGYSWNNRYHVRHRMQGPDASEPWLGLLSLGAAHYENDTGCGHVVAGSPDWPTALGGFVAGKWELVYRWSNWGSTPHLFLESQFWNNKSFFQQCDSTWQQGDGWVDFLRID